MVLFPSGVTDLLVVNLSKGVHFIRVKCVLALMVQNPCLSQKNFRFLVEVENVMKWVENMLFDGIFW
jgi:hypothetical protein